MSRIIVTGRRWKKAASLYCALVLRPDLDAKGRADRKKGKAKQAGENVRDAFRR